MGVISLITSLIVLALSIIPIIVVSIGNRERALKILIALDQLYAVIVFGAEDITISSLLYYYKYKKPIGGFRGALITLTYHFVNGIAKMFGQSNHCEQSYYNELAEFEEYVNIYKEN